MQRLFVCIAVFVLFTLHTQHTPAQTQERIAPSDFDTAFSPPVLSTRNFGLRTGSLFRVGSVPFAARTRRSVPNTYILNTTETQLDANFNISGNGVAGGTLSASIINADTQFNLGGQRILTDAGSNNVFVGRFAGGYLTEPGRSNTYVGVDIAVLNSSGFENSFFGYQAGFSNTQGAHNSYFGVDAGRNSRNYASNNSFFGHSAGVNNGEGDGNSFFGKNAGDDNSDGSDNVFLGLGAGSYNVSGSFNTAVGARAGFNSYNFRHATAIGAGSVAKSSNSITLGRPAGEDVVRMPGALILERLSIGGTAPLCRNGFLVVSTCSSSLRYKSNILPFRSGLDLIRQLRPVTFNWKDGGMQDLGLVAEEVNKIEPLLTTSNEKGEVEGVKYDRLAVVLINSIKEQQRVIENLQTRIDALMSLVCVRNQRAAACLPSGSHVTGRNALKPKETGHEKH